MYQGEVYVQELNLPSFLEIAEDLSIRDLSEGNTDKFTGILGKNAENTTFEEERPLQLSNQNIQNNDDRKQSLVALSENIFPCENCDKQFSSSQGLSFHKKSVHFGIKYSCHLCNHKGTTQFSLNKHITSVHEGKHYPCNKCDCRSTE